MDKVEQNAVIKRLLYESRLEEEYEWRKRKENRADAKLLDRLLSRINKFGYNYKNKTDLLQQYVLDENVLMVILDYLGKFNDPGVTAILVSVIGNKKNKVATKKIIDVFNSADLSRKHLAVFYDNAFNRLKDKRYIENYLDWLKEPRLAAILPFTMIMLARWKDLRAKQLFIQHLDSGIKGQLVFTCIEALSIYDDEESINKIKTMVGDENDKVSKCARDARERLSKKSGKKNRATASPTAMMS